MPQGCVPSRMAYPSLQTVLTRSPQLFDSYSFPPCPLVPLLPPFASRLRKIAPTARRDAGANPQDLFPLEEAVGRFVCAQLEARQHVWGRRLVTVRQMEAWRVGLEGETHVFGMPCLEIGGVCSFVNVLQFRCMTCSTFPSYPK